MALKPIVHGVFTNEIPDKCQKCIYKLFSLENNRWECSKRSQQDGKFIGTIAYSCFKRAQPTQK